MNALQQRLNELKQRRDEKKKSLPQLMQNCIALQAIVIELESLKDESMNNGHEPEHEHKQKEEQEEEQHQEQEQ